MSNIPSLDRIVQKVFEAARTNPDSIKLLPFGGGMEMQRTEDGSFLSVLISPMPQGEPYLVTVTVLHFDEGGIPNNRNIRCGIKTVEKAVGLGLSIDLKTLDPKGMNNLRAELFRVEKTSEEMATKTTAEVGSPAISPVALDI
jgi:hypothetical protein